MFHSGNINPGYLSQCNPLSNELDPCYFNPDDLDHFDYPETALFRIAYGIVQATGSI